MYSIDDFEGKRSKITCSELIDLPPRLIIDLLSFIECTLEPVTQELREETMKRGRIYFGGKYDVFGYFKRDIFRNIWMMFTSIRMRGISDFRFSNKTNYIVNNYYIDFPKLRCLEIHQVENTLLKTLLEHSQLYLLKKLKINLIQSFAQTNIFDKLFSLNNSQTRPKSISKVVTRSYRFPKLKKLVVEHYNGQACKWDPKILDNLNFFWILFGLQFPIISKGYFSSLKFSKLTKLVICEVSFQETAIWRIPLVRSVSLQNVRNLEFLDCDKIRFIQCFNYCPSLILDRFLQKIKNVQDVRILGNSRNSDETFEWFLKTPFDKVETMTMGNLSEFTGTSKYIRLENCKNLRKLKIFECNQLVEDFFFKKIGSLKSLVIKGCSLLEYSGTQKWEIMDSLEEFLVERVKLTDKFFEDHEFRKLRSLSLNSLRIIGNIFNSTINPCSLSILNIQNFPDQFFFFKRGGGGGGGKEEEEVSNNNFKSKLEELVVRRNRKITGIGWIPSFYETLKYIEFTNCFALKDQMFSNNIFANLESLKITKCPIIRGLNWMKLGNLRRLEVQECHKFGDHFFQNQESPNLEIISIRDCSSPLEGKNWKFMKNLVEIYVDSPICCENIEKEFPFPVSCVFWGGVKFSKHVSIQNFRENSF